MSENATNDPNITKKGSNYSRFDCNSMSCLVRTTNKFSSWLWLVALLLVTMASINGPLVEAKTNVTKHLKMTSKHLDRAVSTKKPASTAVTQADEEQEEEEDYLSICRISPKNLRLDLRGTLIFNSKIYLITRDWLVYVLPIDNLHDSQMMINVTAKPIAQIWPTLESPDSKFPKIKSNVEIIFGFNNDKRPELLFLARNEVGVLLNLQTGSLVHRYKIVFPPEECALLSNLANDFHSISTNETAHDHIYFQPWTVEVYGDSNHIKTMRPIKQYNYAFVDIGRRLIMTEEVKHFNRVPIDYRTFNGTVMNGFIWNGLVHLFGVDTVYIFDKAAIITQGYPVDLQILDSSKYWSCELVYKGDKKKIGMAVGIIVAIIIIILAVVLCCLFLVKRETVKNKQDNKQGRQSRARQTEPKNSTRAAGGYAGAHFGGSGKKSDQIAGAPPATRSGISEVPGGSEGGAATANSTSEFIQQPICATVSNMTAVRSGEKNVAGSSNSAVVSTATTTTTTSSNAASSTASAATSTSSSSAATGATPTTTLVGSSTIGSIDLKQTTNQSLPNRSKLVTSALTPTSQVLSAKSSNVPTNSTIQKVALDEKKA